MSVTYWRMTDGTFIGLDDDVSFHCDVNGTVFNARIAEGNDPTKVESTDVSSEFILSDAVVAVKPEEVPADLRAAMALENEDG